MDFIVDTEHYKKPYLPISKSNNMTQAKESLMLIVGVDPGKSIGYFYGEYLTSTDELAKIEAGEAYGIEGARFLASLPADAYVIEDFQLFKDKLNEVYVNDNHLETVQVIGALKALLPASKVWLQKPQIKKAVPDEMLKDIGLYHKSLHARDATRHVIYFLARLKNKGEI